MSYIIRAEGGEQNQQNFFKELICLCKKYKVMIYPVISSEPDEKGQYYPNIRFSFPEASFISLDDGIEYDCSNSFEKEYFDDELNLGETITVYNQNLSENINT